MSLYNHHEILLYNLAERFGPFTMEYWPKEEAYRELVASTGQDFGDDVPAWHSWLYHAKLVGIAPDAWSQDDKKT